MCQTRAHNGRKNLSNSNSCQGIPTMGRARKPKRAISGIFSIFFLKRAEILQTDKNPGRAETFAPLKI